MLLHFYMCIQIEKLMECALLQDSRYTDIFIVSLGKVEGVYYGILSLFLFYFFVSPLNQTSFIE